MPTEPALLTTPQEHSPCRIIAAAEHTAPNAIGTPTATSMLIVCERERSDAAANSSLREREMTVTLNQLDMTPDEAASDHAVVERMAYFNWLNAGRPPGRCLEFWLAAEREWIERCYVPRRNVAAVEEQAGERDKQDPTPRTVAKSSPEPVPV